MSFLTLLRLLIEFLNVVHQKPERLKKFEAVKVSFPSQSPKGLPATKPPKFWLTRSRKEKMSQSVNEQAGGGESGYPG